MQRRTVLATGGTALLAGISGCLSRLPGIGLDTKFEETVAEVPVDEPPAVSADGDVVTARGTIQHASSNCGTIELAHATYERSQHRLDLLIVAADDSSWRISCTDDLVESGYRVRAEIDADLRRVAVTEHHVFGDTYSTTVDLTDW